MNSKQEVGEETGLVAEVDDEKEEDRGDEVTVVQLLVQVPGFARRIHLSLSNYYQSPIFEVYNP